MLAHHFATQVGRSPGSYLRSVAAATLTMLALAATPGVAVPPDATEATVTSSPADKKTAPLPFTGVNLAGGEFNHPELGKKPRYGIVHFFPAQAEFTYFAGKGMNIIRVPSSGRTCNPRSTGRSTKPSWTASRRW